MRFVLVLLALSSAASAAPKDPLDAFCDAWLRVHPFEATELGVHDYDAQVPKTDDASRAAWAKALRVHRAAIGKTPKGCDAACKVDHEVALRHIDAELFELEELRPHDRWPDAWVSYATAAVFPIVKRDFAPASERAASVIARLHGLRGVLAPAKKHLMGPLVAPIAVEIALEDLQGAMDFIRNDVPKAFGSSLSQDQRAQLDKALLDAMSALTDFHQLLMKDVKPHAKAEIAIGGKLLARKLLLDEMIDEPLEPLLARGEMELYHLQAAMKEVAHTIDPRGVQEARATLGHDHAPREAVIPETQARLAALRKFLVERKIVTVPSEVMPIVDETPPFMRAMTQASMDSPGPFETKAHEAYYHLTLPEPSWPKERAEDLLMGSLSRPLLDVVSIHEAFPGHYLQFLWIPKVTSRVRRMTYTASNVEGWAHYSEQMMLDSGWAAGKPLTKLAQLQDALLRAARYVVAIRMHDKGMTVEAAERFFVDEGMQAQEVAKIEAKRATEDPTFLYYTWGKLQLLALRNELQQKWGKDFTLERFHDAVLVEGPIPLPILRRVLLAK